MSSRPAFPFAAVVGQVDAKLALRLTAVDHRIGGVLLRGEKGSAKTTLVRGFAALLGGGPFVELPLGASEDRVIGSIDTRAALVEGELRFRPGLLAAADGGVLYVDEINLLADHLVDVLLDVAVSGENVVERDGVSHRHPARFVLVGSMNPEEGELRPQLLDRFGLCVEVSAPTSIEDRVESVRRRLAFDGGDAVDVPSEELPARPTTTAVAPDAILDAACRLAVAVGAEGLRADLVLVRAATALASLDGATETTLDHLERVAPLVLAHRSRRNPFDPPVVPPEQLERTIHDTLRAGPSPAQDPGRSGGDGGDGGDDGEHEGDGDGSSGGAGDEAPPGRGTADRPMVIGSARRPPTPTATRGSSPRGRIVGAAPAGPGDQVAVLPTLQATLQRRAGDPTAALAEDDLRAAVRVEPRPRTVVLAVDLSGSMGAATRAEAATGCVLGLLADAYVRRESVALVGFRDEAATVLLAPTASVEVARNRLDGLATGGGTPLAEGIRTALEVARQAVSADRDALLALLTDGRASGGRAGYEAALEAAQAVRAAGIPVVVLDCEDGATRLGLAAHLAEAMGGQHVAVTALDPVALSTTLRATAGR
jgi:magnesium chelatase subunit D